MRSQPLFKTHLFVALSILCFDKVLSGKFKVQMLRRSDSLLVEIQDDGGGSNNSSNVSESWKSEGFFPLTDLSVSAFLKHGVANGVNLEKGVKRETLLAPNAAFITTKLKDFHHTFLAIKFTSIIGKLPIEAVDSTQKSTLLLETYTTSQRPSSNNTFGEFVNTNASSFPHSAKSYQEKEALIPHDEGQIPRGHPKLNSEEHSTPVKNNPRKSVKTPSRKTRSLDVEDLLQIQKIILSATQEKKEKAVEKEVMDQRALVQPDHNEYVKVGQSDMEADAILLKHRDKLSYQTWKASLDKSFRPPGFYISIDDKIVFDNWEGVWYSSKVLGHSTRPNKRTPWNETQLLIQFDEDIPKDVKVSLEWEPTDPSAYLLLTNISIFTYDSSSGSIKEDSVPQNDPVPTKVVNPTTTTTTTTPDDNGNQNITLFIVLKNGKPIVGTNSAQDPNIHFVPYSEKYDENGGKGLENGEQKVQKVISKTPKPKKSKGSSSRTGLIVSGVFGLFCFLIMVVLIRKKITLSSTRQSGRRNC